MKSLTWISLLLALLLAVLAPIVFADLIARSLAKLHLAPSIALLLTASILVGGLFNIPLKRIVATEELWFHPLDAFGLGGLLPWWGVHRREILIAVNVGGCVIPSAVAVYELAHFVLFDPGLVANVLLGVGVNVVLCYLLARPLPEVGIVMPGLVPALAAAVLGLVLAPTQAAPAAFVIGVAGPLVGADLLHLRSVERIGAGVVSIGGAGTFDGIVLSAILAAYLA